MIQRERKIICPACRSRSATYSQGRNTASSSMHCPACTLTQVGKLYSSYDKPSLREDSERLVNWVNKLADALNKNQGTAIGTTADIIKIYEQLETDVGQLLDELRSDLYELTASGQQNEIMVDELFVTDSDVARGTDKTVYRTSDGRATITDKRHDAIGRAGHDHLSRLASLFLSSDEKE